MKPIDPLKIQALVDGELNDSEAALLRRELEQCTESKGLHDALVSLRTAVRSGESECQIPVPADFYWRTIASRIDRQSAAGERNSGGSSATLVAFLIRRWFPILGSSAILFVILGAFWLQIGGMGRYARLGTNHDIERTSGEISTISFRSESEGLTVVWLDTHPVE